MNPGLVVKLRPAGPWRIGPDSGARNRVDVIYHSDSLYSAVTSAMARLGSLDDWLGATARGGAPAVCFSSCFPFLGEIGFVVPPRTVWPPTSPALMSARVRWKSARFVPLTVVQAILAGEKLNEHHWNVDGPSECLVPAGSHGPFRTGVRWNAAVDRLSGLTERHSTACIEFHPGAGLWTIVSFADEAAQARWLEPVKAAFRLLADTGFGGERSRGWGRSEQPEFVEGMLPDMVLGTVKTKSKPQPAETEPEPEPAVTAPEVQSAGEPVATEEHPPAEPEPAVAAAEPEPAIEEPPAAQEQPPAEAAAQEQPPAEPEPAVAAAEPEAAVEEPAAAPEQPPAEPAVAAAEPEAAVEEPAAAQGQPPAEPEPAVAAAEPKPVIEEPAPTPAVAASEAPTPPIAEPPAETPEPAEAAVLAPREIALLAATSEPPAPQPAPEPHLPAEPDAPPSPDAPPPVEPAAPPTAAAALPAPGAPPAAEPTAPPSHDRPPAALPGRAHWMLSLFTPAPGDTVDWRRGNYAVLSRGGRVESPAGSGELKKQVQMVAEGSVLFAAAEPRGAAADVAPEGFAHPVFRAGFAVSIPLPEVG